MYIRIDNVARVLVNGVVRQGRLSLFFKHFNIFFLYGEATIFTFFVSLSATITSFYN